MITRIRHRGLRRLFESGQIRGINPAHADRLRRILALLNTANTPSDMDLPGLYLHELRGNRQGVFSVRVSGNWQVTFRIDNGDVYDVDYEDYH